MNRLNYSVQYAIYQETKEINFTLEKDDVLCIFSPEHNSHTSLFTIGSNTYHLENGHCLTIITDNKQYLKSPNGHSQLPAICCVLTIPKSQVATSILEQFHKRTDNKNLVATFNNSRIEFLLNELAIVERDQACKFKTCSILFELISLQLERISDEGIGVDRQIHYDKVLHTKRLIEENLAHTYTIPELAKLAGTNEQYLKKYFKLYSGKTISQYTLEVKMTFAKNLLIAGKHRVADIARMIGYKHSTHFTTAFKRYFGFIPNSLRY